MNTANDCGSVIPYKGLTPFQEKDKLFFFGRKPECQTIIDNLQVWRLTVLYGDSGVGKSSILRAGVLHELNQDAQRNLDKYGYPGHVGIVFPPVSDKSTTEVEKQCSWQDPSKGIKIQIKLAVESLGIKEKVDDENNDKSLAETLKAWTNIVIGEYGRGKIYIILDQFEEYFGHLSSPKTDRDLLEKLEKFSKEFVEAINDKDLNANFLISITKNSLAALDYFKKDLQDLLFKHRLELKLLDPASAYEAIEKPIHEYNRYNIIRDSLYNSPVTVLCGNPDTHKSVLLREGVYQYLKQDGKLNQEKNDNPEIAAVVFSSWYDNTLEKLVDKIQAEIKDLGIDKIPEIENSLVETLQNWTRLLVNEDQEGKLFIIFDQFEEYFWNKNKRDRLLESLRKDLKPKLFSGLLASFVLLREFLCYCQDEPIVQLLNAIKNNELKNVNILISIRENWYPAIPIEFKDQISCQSYLHLFNEKQDIQGIGEIYIPKIHELPIEVKPHESKEYPHKIDIEQNLPKLILEDIKSESDGQITSPYLQLVMESLWQEDCGSHLLKETTYEKLGKTQGIAERHIEKKMGQLELEDRRAAAYSFDYLITPSGMKILYPVDDLFKKYQEFRERVFLDKLKIKLIEKVQFNKLLNRLTSQEYRLLSAESTEKGDFYKIYHDVLIKPILKWQKEFVNEENEKIQRVEERSERENCVNKILEESVPHFTNDKIRQKEIISLLLRQAYLFNKKYELDRLVEIDSALRQALSTDYFSSILYDANPNANSKDISSVAVSQDGQWLASGSYDGTVRVWDLYQRGSSPIDLKSPDEKNEKIVTSTAFSQDQGSIILAVGREDGTVQLWEQNNIVSGWINFKTFTAHTGVGRVNVPGEADKQPEVRAIAFCPKNNLLATGSWDSTVCLWDLDNLDNPLATLPHDDWIWSVAFSPDGQTLAAGCRNGTVRLWKLGDDWKILLFAKAKLYQFLLQFLQNSPNCLIFQGEDLVLHPDRDWRNRDNQYRWDRQVFAVAFHPQNSDVLAVGSWDGKVRVWRLSHSNPVPEILSGQEEMQIEKDAVRSLAFSPDGQWLIAGRDNQEIWRWEWENPEAKLIKLEKGHDLGISSLAFTPDSQMFVSGGWDSRVRLWDRRSPTAEPIILEKHTDKVVTVAFSPSGKMLASGSYDHTTRLWGWDKEKYHILPNGHQGNVNSVAFSPDGQILASGNEERMVQLWDLHNSNGVLNPLSCNGEKISSVEFNPRNSRILAVGSYDKKVWLWDLSNPNQPKCLQILEGHKDKVNSVAFSPDGNILASGDSNHIVRLWWNLELPNASSIELLRFEGRISSIAFSLKPFKELQMLAVATNNENPTIETIELWDISPLQKSLDAEPVILSQYSSLKELKGTCVAFSPDGLFLASGSYDCKVRLWDLQQPKANPIVLEGFTKPIITLAFSPDGEWIVAGSEDNTIRIWIAKTKIIADMVCEKVWRNLTFQEWKDWVSKNILYERTCPNLPLGMPVSEQTNTSSDEVDFKKFETRLSLKQKELLKVIEDATSEEEIAKALNKSKLNEVESIQLDALCRSGFITKTYKDQGTIRYRIK